MKSEQKRVVLGIAGISLLYAGFVEGLALSGVNFGDIPIVTDWPGGLLPALCGGAAALLLRTAFFKNGNGH